MAENVYLMTMFMLFGTVLLIFGMRFLSAQAQARARAAGDNAYRDLAAQAVSVQAGTASALSSIQAELSQISARLAAVEKILKEVG